MSRPDDVFAVPVLLANGVNTEGEFRVWEQAPEDESSVALELHLNGRLIRALAENFFDALSLIRAEIEPEGLRLGCYGCSRDVFPSSMILSMGYGEKAYRLRAGMPAKSEDLVSIFETGPGIDPVTLAEQEKYYEDWLNSFG